jgi:hypothetical protein
MKRIEPLDPRRMGRIALAIDELLRSLGITDAIYTKTKHAKVKFSIGPHSVTCQFACTPRDEDNAIKLTLKQIRRKIQDVCANGTPGARRSAT